jgi:hypothetical protein
MYREYKMTSEREGRSSGSSSAMSNTTGGNTRVPEDDLKKSSTEVWKDKDFFFTLRMSS